LREAPKQTFYAMNISAIIVAAGNGRRLGLPIPKAFVDLGGRTMLSWSLAAVRAVSSIGELVLTAPAEMQQSIRTEVTAAGLEIPVKIVPGGAERQDSVRNALALTSALSEVVVVHDAARPFATPRMFDACISAAIRSGAAIIATPLADTLKRADGSTISATISRAGLWQAQTPQAFRRDLLLEAHERALSKHITTTDDAGLVEQLGAPVEIVEGSTLNLKITTPDDLKIASVVAAHIALQR
jgi:2-C-methyl-D-erythritol 4-phosphate cytidylyltransferase